MPPARPRVLEDARSETSITNSKDRVVSGPATSKTKKAAALNASNALSAPKAGVNSAAAAPTTATGAASAEHESPHVDWSVLPVHALHSYRSAYRLQIPSSYTKPHAELLYNSCDLALRAPSQVLARRKAYDLKRYRKKQAQSTSSSRTRPHGVSKGSKSTRARERDNGSKRANGKDKEADDETTDTPMLSVEGPPSPTSHPSQQDSSSNPPDNASRTSRHSPTISTMDHQPQSEEDPDTIPSSLNQVAPEETVVGSLSPNNLATSIRTHFNAQQVNEAETIAKFTYVVRQQGSSTAPRIHPLSQRLSILPLPQTTAESIAAVASNAGNTTLDSLAPVAAAAPGASAAGTGAEKGKANAHTAHSLSAPRALGGNHIEMEGSYGDGNGWIVSSTSCGRQIRIQDGGGGGSGTFRLRFRPT